MSQHECAGAESAAAFSVVIPVYNESELLERTVPSVLAAISGTNAQVVYVCNGCHDDSAEKIRRLSGDRVEVVELEDAGKTQALNRGDSIVAAFPRFYLDADVVLPLNAFSKLVAVLENGGVDLVSPLIHFDTSRCTWAARAIAEVWLALPHAKNGAYHHLLGVSRLGRSNWQVFPNIIADDAYIESQIPQERRRIVTDVRITTWAPITFFSWARVRARWIQGQRQLSRLRIAVQSDPTQGSTLLLMLRKRSTCVQAMLYLLNRIASILVCSWTERFGGKWFHDRA